MQVAKPWQGSDDHLLENVVLSPGVEIKGTNPQLIIVMLNVLILD